MATLIGPFTQMLTMDELPSTGPIRDENMQVITDAGIRVHEGKIIEAGKYSQLIKSAGDDSLEVMDGRRVAMPGFIDAHTHMCFAGSRADEYSMRIAGENYSTILARGGGIYNTVDKTRSETFSGLMQSLAERAGKHFIEGITTSEVKSGYGLNVEEEIRILKVIRETNNEITPDLVPTCLAAHVVPPDFPNEKNYLD